MKLLKFRSYDFSKDKKKEIKNSNYLNKDKTKIKVHLPQSPNLNNLPLISVNSNLKKSKLHKKLKKITSQTSMELMNNPEVMLKQWLLLIKENFRLMIQDKKENNENKNLNKKIFKSQRKDNKICHRNFIGKIYYNALLNTNSKKIKNKFFVKGIIFIYL